MATDLVLSYPLLLTASHSERKQKAAESEFRGRAAALTAAFFVFSQVNVNKRQNYHSLYFYSLWESRFHM